MRVIEIDASGWETWLDFACALKTAIAAPDWHGASINAFIDSMIWGGINSVEPPYTIRIVKTANLPADVADHIRVMASAIDRDSNHGTDPEVSLVAPGLPA
jgi:hypothetical protein